MIRTEFSSLYNGKDRLIKEGEIHSGEELLKLINYGRTKEGKIILFTYVIVNNYLRFSPTGKLLKNMFSKHTIHSNCSPDVTYAGEFHVQKKEDKYILVIDNNSGTYKPNPEDLPLVKQLIIKNFPGVDLDIVAVGSVELESYHKIINSCNHSFLFINHPWVEIVSILIYYSLERKFYFCNCICFYIFYYEF